MPVLTDVLGDVDDILGLRDDLGVELHKVYMVTRTWTGTEIGDGTFADVVVQMLPTPRVYEYGDNYKIREGGMVKMGDIKLKMVSKQSYPLRASIDGTVPTENVQKFYLIGGVYFSVVGGSVEERHVTWNLLLRRSTDQRAPT